MVKTARQSVELFHLVFLRALLGRGDAKGLIALKGGCNLRFFFGSVRYSEDMDLDATIIAEDTLTKKVNQLLASPLVSAPLKAQGISIVDVSAPKQTETTQRWKIGLARVGTELPVRTKIEFSRRGGIEGAALDAVDAELLRSYALMPLLVTHYTAHAAIEQKLRALAGRTEPQARDVFDLALLFSRPESASLTLGAAASQLDAAIERAIGISFDEYAAQVVSYLDPVHAELYASREAWDAMQEEVVRRIEAAR